MRYADGTRAGPIALDRRLRSSKGPIDYTLLVYEKGAWVVHMLRMLLYDFEAESDEPWRRVMRDFVRAWSGKDPSTEDLRQHLEAALGRDLGWFFDAWVYGTAVPRFTWDWRADTERGEPVLDLRVEQEVESGQPLRVPVPVAIELDDGRRLVRRIQVEGVVSEHRLRLGAKPVKVEFNVGDAVLCEARAGRH